MATDLTVGNSTDYPKGKNIRTSQRSPVAYIGEEDTTVHAVNGAIATNASNSRIVTTDTDRPIRAIHGSQIINSAEAGSIPITGSAYGAIVSNIKDGNIRTGNAAKARPLFVIDSGAAPTKPSLNSASAVIVSGGYDLAGHKYAKYFKCGTDVVYYTVDDNTNFDTIWNFQNPAGSNVVFENSVVTTGSLKLISVAGAETSAYAAALNKGTITASTNYVLMFEYVTASEIGIPIVASVCSGTVTPNPTFSATVNEYGTFVGFFKQGASSNTQAGVVFELAANTTANDKIVYIKNVRIAPVSEKDISTTFNAQNEKGRYKGGGKNPVSVDYVGV